MEQDDPLARPGQVGEQRALLVVGEDLGADRDLDDEVRAAGAGAVGAGAALAARGAEMLGVAEVDQGIEAGHRLEHDVAALAAVAAVGPAELDELLAPEADRAGAAGARPHVDLGLVEEMHGRELGDAGEEGNLRESAQALVHAAEGAILTGMSEHPQHLRTLVHPGSSTARL